MSVLRIPDLVEERLGAIRLKDVVLDTKVTLPKHGERSISDPGVQPTQEDPRTTGCKSESHATKRGCKEGTNDAVVIWVAIQPVRQSNQLPALYCIAVVVDRTKHKHSEESATTTHHEIKAIQHVKAGCQAQKHRWNHRQASQVSYQKHLQNININNS